MSLTETFGKHGELYCSTVSFLVQCYSRLHMKLVDMIASLASVVVLQLLHTSSHRKAACLKNIIPIGNTPV